MAPVWTCEVVAQRASAGGTRGHAASLPEPARLATAHVVTNKLQAALVRQGEALDDHDTV
jgi:hypothetical protein